jgi:hypothetical protein
MTATLQRIKEAEQKMMDAGAAFMDYIERTHKQGATREEHDRLNLELTAANEGFLQLVQDFRP